MTTSPSTELAAARVRMALGVEVPLSQIRERRVHLAIPAGRIEPGQAALLRGMKARAKRVGVVVRITRVR